MRGVAVIGAGIWALATRGEAVVETGATAGIAALRVILEAVGR